MPRASRPTPTPPDTCVNASLRRGDHGYAPHVQGNAQEAHEHSHEDREDDELRNPGGEAALTIVVPDRGEHTCQRHADQHLATCTAPRCTRERGETDQDR